jgi:hypothetical protein
MGTYEHSIDIDFKVDHPGNRCVADNSVVQCLVTRNCLIAAQKIDPQHPPFLHAWVADKYLLKLGKKLAKCNGGEKAKTCVAIPRQYRNLSSADSSRGGKQCAVSAKHDM